MRLSLSVAAWGAALMMIASSARADWKAPTDNKFTEKQLTQYIAAATEWTGEIQQVSRQISDSNTAAGVMSATNNLDAKLNAIVARNGLTREEYDWVAQKALEAYGASITVEAMQQSNDQIIKQMKENSEKLADAQKRLADAQAAQKSGQRVLTDDDKAAAIKTAKDDAQAATEEIKQHTDEASAANDEAKQHDADAKAADDAAAHPGSDMTGDDRTNFVNDKTAEAKSARDAAADARKRETDAKAAIEACKARIAGDTAKIDHPEVPLTDDEKNSAKSDNENAISAAQSDINSATTLAGTLTQMQTQMTQVLQESAKNVPPQNIDLIRKHKDEYIKVWTALNGAQTQPSK